MRADRMSTVEEQVITMPFSGTWIRLARCLLLGFTKCRGMVIISAMLLSGFYASGQNVYSGGTGNYNANQWYLDQARTLPFVGVHKVQGNGDHISHAFKWILCERTECLQWRNR